MGDRSCAVAPNWLPPWACVKVAVFPAKVPIMYPASVVEALSVMPTILESLVWKPKISARSVVTCQIPSKPVPALAELDDIREKQTIQIDSNLFISHFLFEILVRFSKVREILVYISRPVKFLPRINANAMVSPIANNRGGSPQNRQSNSPVRFHIPLTPIRARYERPQICLRWPRKNKPRISWIVKWGGQGCEYRDTLTVSVII